MPTIHRDLVVNNLPCNWQLPALNISLERVSRVVQRVVFLSLSRQMPGGYSLKNAMSISLLVFPDSWFTIVNQTASHGPTAAAWSQALLDAPHSAYACLRRICTRSGVLTAVKLPTLVFWVVTPFGLSGRFQRFGGTHDSGLI
jgi:hypothetical protein